MNLDDGFSDSSDLVIFGVIGLLVCGVFGVLIFLQYKFMICKEFLCIKCDKKKKGKNKSTPGGKKKSKHVDESDEQMDANDIIHKRKKKKGDDLPEGLSDESSSQNDYDSRNMLGSDVASGHEINHEIASNVTGAAFPPAMNGDQPMDQEQMAKMFEMFQQM